MKKMIDLRSDTVTKPTPQMYEAIREAELGDEEMGEDITTKDLESLASEILGKESALFVPSGTMGNQIALLTHTNPGEAVIVERDSHIYRLESAAMARLSHVLPLSIAGYHGYMNPEEIVRCAIRSPERSYWAEPTLLCIENTHNFHGGVVLNPHQMEEMFRTAKDCGLSVHLDGARLFNAAVFLGVRPEGITCYCDSVMISLCKGLCCPIGAILAGDSQFIKKARKMRKMLGGGMRQVGMLAACGIVGLTSMIERLKEDHIKARKLAEKLFELKEVNFDIETVQTNIVYFGLRKNGLNTADFVRLCKERGVLVSVSPDKRIRLVTHYDVSMEDIDKACEILVDVIKNISQ